MLPIVSIISLYCSREKSLLLSLFIHFINFDLFFMIITKILISFLYFELFQFSILQLHLELSSILYYKLLDLLQMHLHTGLSSEIQSVTFIHLVWKTILVSPVALSYIHQFSCSFVLQLICYFLPKNVSQYLKNCWFSYKYTYNYP